MSEASQADFTYSGLPLIPKTEGSSFLRRNGEFGGEENLVAAAANGFADEHFVVADAVSVGGVEEIYAEIESAEEGGCGFGVVALAVKFAHAHAAESHAGDEGALRAEFYFFHGHKFSPGSIMSPGPRFRRAQS